MFDRFYRAAAARGRAGLRASGWRSCGRSPRRTAGRVRAERAPGGGALLRLRAAGPLIRFLLWRGQPLSSARGSIWGMRTTSHPRRSLRARPRWRSPPAAASDAAPARRRATGEQHDARRRRSRYARCMREHGVDMPDPEPAAARGIRRGRQVATAEDCARPRRRARKHREAIKPPEITEEQQKEFKQAALANARCMREHGSTSPTRTFDEDGGAQIQIGKGSGIDPDDPKFQEAAGGVPQDDCRGLRRRRST